MPASATDRLDLTPAAIELLDYRDDGEATRHYRFRYLHLQQAELTASLEPNPGQFFMLTLPGVGEAAFTYTRAPDRQGVFHALIRKTGSVTQALFECPNGSVLGIRGPFGRGWPMARLSQKNILIVAGGCGLAPLVRLIDSLTTNTDPATRPQHLALLYGARNSGLQTLTPERQHWSRSIPIFHVLEDHDSQINGTDSYSGTPLSILDLVLQKLNWDLDTLLLCGPEAMMTATAKDFIARGLPAASIWLSIERRMHCAVGLCGHCYLNQHDLAHHSVCRDGPTYCWEQLQST